MDALIRDFVGGGEAAQTEAFASLLRIFRDAGKADAAADSFPNDALMRVMSASFEGGVSAADAFVADALVRKAMQRFMDVRFYGMRNLRRILERDGARQACRIFELLLGVPCPAEDELADAAVLVPLGPGADPQHRSIRHVRGEFSSLWFALLPHLPSEKHEKLLAVLDRDVLPHLYEPEMLVSFLTDAYRAGGIVGVLALDGLFTLVRRYNVNVPDFYNHLYALLDNAVLTAPHRVVFLRALGRFMSSTMVPAYVVAAMAKRFARLMLGAPPSAIVWGVPFIYNMLKRHPACRVMIHRETPSGEAVRFDTDPFDAEEPQTLRCRAIESCLWELEVLERHCWARVSRLPAIFRERFTKPEFDLDEIAQSMDLVDTISAANDELGHLWSRRPPTVLDIPERIF